jgi:hypothetical protein
MESVTCCAVDIEPGALLAAPPAGDIASTTANEPSGTAIATLPKLRIGEVLMAGACREEYSKALAETKSTLATCLAYSIRICDAQLHFT